MNLVWLVLIGGWVSWADSRRMVVPDAAVMCGLAAVVAGCFAGTFSWAASLWGLVLATAQFGLVYLLLRGRLGLGDVKYAGFLGALLGPFAWQTALAAAAVFALLHVLIVSAMERTLFKGPVPFAPFMTAGGLTAMILFWGLG